MGHLVRSNLWQINILVQHHRQDCHRDHQTQDPAFSKGCSGAGTAVVLFMISCLMSHVVMTIGANPAVW